MHLRIWLNKTLLHWDLQTLHATITKINIKYAKYAHSDSQLVSSTLQGQRELVRDHGHYELI